MKITIHNNAKDVYIGDCNCHRQPINWEWAATLEKIQGMTLPIETEYLFANQFNIGPIPGVSLLGLRLMWRFGELDYEGDVKLEAAHRLMAEGKIQCHSYRHDTGEFVDLRCLYYEHRPHEATPAKAEEMVQWRMAEILRERA